MDPQEYLSNRLDDQIAWYDSRSQKNKRWFYSLRIIELIAAALIPFVASQITAATLGLKPVVVLLGVLVVITAGLLAVLRVQELWIEYRTMTESLRHEKYLYMTKTEPYDIEDPFQLLVQRVESRISKQHTSWAEYIQGNK